MKITEALKELRAKRSVHSPMKGNTIERFIADAETDRPIPMIRLTVPGGVRDDIPFPPDVTEMREDRFAHLYAAQHFGKGPVERSVASAPKSAPATPATPPSKPDK